MQLENVNNLSELLHGVVNAETNYIQNRLHSIDINQQQARLLKYIGDHPGTIQKDVAAYLNRQSATVTNMLKTIEKRGYISRKIPANNERQKQLFLLPAGEETVARIRTIFLHLEGQIETAVPVNQQKLFITQLESITENLETGGEAG